MCVNLSLGKVEECVQETAPETHVHTRQVREGVYVVSAIVHASVGGDDVFETPHQGCERECVCVCMCVCV
jgi:hypothetical protein